MFVDETTKLEEDFLNLLISAIQNSFVFIKGAAIHIESGAPVIYGSAIEDFVIEGFTDQFINCSFSDGFTSNLAADEHFQVCCLLQVGCSNGDIDLLKYSARVRGLSEDGVEIYVLDENLETMDTLPNNLLVFVFVIGVIYGG